VLVEAGLVRANGSRDTKAAAAYVTRVCGELGMPVLRTPTKAVALGKEVLDAIPDDLLTAYSIYSQASTYTARVDDMCQGFELPLQPRFNTMLETRRTSTSKPRAPLIGIQAQNFPRQLMVGRGAKTPKHPRGEPIYAPVGARECLTPPPGFVFIQADLPTAELRSVSQACLEWFNFSLLAEAINAGKDVHHILGGVIENIAYEEMIRRADEPAIKHIRDQAKPGNFGFWGLMGPEAFMAYAWKNYRIRFSLERATQIHEAWKRSWPEHAPYFDAASKRARSSGQVVRFVDKRTGENREMAVSALRHPVTGYWRGRCGATQQSNSPFQERTGVAASRALCEVQYRGFCKRSSALYGGWPIMYTHDEIVGVVPREQGHEGALELGAVMQEKFNELHPLVAIKAMDPVVADIYSKAMKPVRDASGRLVPWRPVADKKAAA
jgi:hypothetical protein